MTASKIREYIRAGMLVVPTEATRIAKVQLIAGLKAQLKMEKKALKELENIIVQVAEVAKEQAA